MNVYELNLIQIVTLLICVHCRIVDAVVTYAHCDQLNVNTTCSCQRDTYMNMEILCTLSMPGKNQSDSAITIIINRSLQVRVICRGDMLAADSKALEAAISLLSVGPDLMLLVTDGCSDAIDTIIRRLSIRKARLLELKAGTNASSNNLTRQQLPKALPVVDNLRLTDYKQLPADLFIDYSQLKFLEIEADVLALQSSVFRPLRNLIGLTLKARISQLPLEMFRAQRRLLNVVFSDGAMQSLSSADFKHLSQLQLLHLPRNKLSHIPAHTFAPLTELLRINLSQNRLRALPANMLAHHLKLITIDLSENQLQVLPPELFARTLRLHELRLSHNQLQSIASELLAPLNYLKLLHLNDNQLRSLQPRSFAHNSELQYLHLQHNRIELNATDMCDIFAPFTHLGELLLRNNSLTHLCEAVAPQKMGSIDLSYNRIVTLQAPALVALACSWVRVDLSHNALQSILLPAQINNSAKMPALDCRSNVALNDNALHCDCLLLNFVLRVHRRYLTARTQINTTNLSCDSPASLHGRLVETLQPNELLCPVIKYLCPQRCRCWARPYDATLIINCTQAQLKTVPALPSLLNTTLVGIELHITDNEINALPLNSTTGYEKVKRIYAAGNQLNAIEAFNLPTQLTHLDVRRNRMARLSNSFYTLLNISHTLSALFLSHNPWACDCATEQLLIAAKVHHQRIYDLDELRCANPRYSKILELAFNDICPEDLTALFVSISLLATGFLITLIVAFYFKYQLELSVWLYAHNACLWCVTEHELDKGKVFDAFISYSHKDERFVIRELLRGLEEGDIPFRVCTHERNWLAGAYIPEQIVQSVEQSRRTIIVLSQHFIESPWARMEFRTAHQSALNERRARIIIIMYGEVVNMDALDTELQAYLKMNTYLKWDDPWFWRKLRYAMPHKRRNLLAAENEPRFVYSPMELEDMSRRARAPREV